MFTVITVTSIKWVIIECNKIKEKLIKRERERIDINERRMNLILMFTIMTVTSIKWVIIE